MDLNALYRVAVDTSPDGIWVLDLEGRILFANPEIARIHGIDEGRLASLKVPDTLDVDGRRQFAEHLADVRRGVPSEGLVEVQWVRSDGSPVWMLVSETVLHDQDGAPHALMHHFTDYSERQTILRSLQTSEDALEDQIRQNALMQAVTSAANQANTLDEVLARARDLVLLHDDWERARAFVPRGGDLMPYRLPDETDADDQDDPDDPFVAAELALARRCAATRAVAWDECRLTVAFPVAVGRTVHAVIAITSAPPLWRFELIESMAVRIGEQLARVAQREQVETELAHARDEAMAASRHKSDFLATMSHEIRTPLNGVIGLNELLLRSTLDPEQHRLASGVQVASRALLEVINEILDFSKIEAGRLELEQVEFAIRPLLDQVAGLLAETARGKGLDLTVSCESTVPAGLRGDPTRLAQVITNLVSNAVKFTEHGRVAVSVCAPPGTDRLCLEVSDTGIGVPAERVASLFDPFTQADTSTTRKYGGTGLGLAICTAIVTAMEGELGYRAHSSGGSVFAVDLPLHPVLATDSGADGDLLPATGSDDEDDEARRVLGGRRVLLIDSRDGEVLRDQLAYWGLNVESVTSVRTALERLASPGADHVDLVLIALAGAEWRVLELAEAMPTGDAAIPLLVVASTSSDDLQQLVAVGVDDVLVRPVLPSVLRTTVVRLATGGSVLTQTAPVDAAPGRGRVLVVEDHPINQMVAEGLLRALGHHAVVVEDGISAVEAAQQGRFDAILMDVQMPLMDGYEATRRIRGNEGDGPRVPIIAMTAAAVEGERERCLAAGMDDFLTKPIAAQLLGDCLGRWVRATGAAVARPSLAPTPPHEPPVLNAARLEELRDLDTPSASYVDRAVGNFVANSVRDVTVMHSALASGGLDQLASVAHRLAGVALNLGAARAGESLRAIEARIRAGETGTAAIGALLAAAEQELERARTALGAALGASAAQVAVDAGAEQPEDEPDHGAPDQRLDHQFPGVGTPEEESALVGGGGVAQDQ